MTVADAVVAAVAAAVPGVQVFDGAVPQQPTSGRWVVVYCDNGRREGTSYTDRRDGRWGFQVSCFASRRDAASWLADKIRDYLLTHRVSASGWSAQLPRHDFSGQASFDDDVLAVSVIQFIDQFSLLAFQPAV